jgi:hypothetical protein
MISRLHRLSDYPLATEPEIDDTVKACPDCETPNQFGELCNRCIDELTDYLGGELDE